VLEVFYSKIEYKHVDSVHESLIKQVGYFAEQYLRYLPREIPDFPSHGADHSIKIIELINNFVDNWEIEFTENEIFLLYIGAWVHDIGCLINREAHNEASVAILENHDVVHAILGQELFTCLKHLVRSHSSTVCIQTKVPLEWGDVETQKICSVFRILDACDITESKCPRGVYDLIKTTLAKDADDYWNGHMNIESLKFLCPSIKVYVGDYEKCAFILDKLKLEIGSVESIFELYQIPFPTVDTIQMPQLGTDD